MAVDQDGGCDQWWSFKMAVVFNGGQSWHGIFN